MLSWQSPGSKPFLRLVSITIIELFLITNSPIPISINSDIRSLARVPSPLQVKADFRQMKSAFSEAPDCYLTPPLKLWVDTKKAKEDKTAAPQPVKVLVVDDEPEMLAVTKETLASPEIEEIYTARSIEEALKVLETNPDINFLVLDFRLDILDFNINGVELCKKAFAVPYNFEGRVVIYSADTGSVVRTLEQDRDLHQKFLNGQISVQAKQAPEGAFELIKNKIILFARGEEAPKPEEVGGITELVIPPLGKLTITPDEISLTLDKVEKFRDCHIIIADDKYYVRDVIQATVSGFFDNLHQAGTAEETIAKVKELRNQGIPDNRIIILADFEFGTEQTGKKRLNGRDLINILRLTKPTEEYPEVFSFRGLIFLVSGSIISKKQIPGFDKDAKDISPKIKERYGVDYMEKNADENFPLNLLKMVYARLDMPYVLDKDIEEAMPGRPLSEPADISFLNGGVSDFETRLKAGLRVLKDLLPMVSERVENKGVFEDIENRILGISALFEFGNVDKKAQFNIRVHNYIGRISAAATHIREIRKKITSLPPSDTQNYETIIKKLDNLTLTMKVTTDYMSRLLELSEQVGGIERVITFKEFMDKTVSIFLRDFGEQISVETDFKEEELADLEMPHGLTLIISFILNNALQQYNLKEHELGFKGKIYFRIDKDQKTLEISILDEAGGIPEDILPRIFIRGFTTKPDGSGFGLYWAEVITDMFGGKIKAENKGNGACFTITLPLDWKRIVEEKVLAPKELVEKVSQILKEGGNPKADKLAEPIAREIHTYSTKIAEITKTRETISFDLLRSEYIRLNIANILSRYFRATCTGNPELFRDIIFEKGSTQQDIEDLLLSLLSLKEVKTKEDITFSYLPPRQAVTLAYDASKGEARILLRSKENLEREKEGITPERRSEYQRLLRHIGYSVHKMSGTNKALMRERVLLNSKISEEEKRGLVNLFNRDFPHEIMDIIHLYTSSNRKLSGFEDDILIIERTDGWRGAISDLVKAFIDLKQRYDEAMKDVPITEYSNSERYSETTMKRIVEEAQILLKLLYGQKIEDKEPIDINEACSDQYFRLNLEKQFHLTVIPGTRLWLKRFFLNNILLNVFRCRTPAEDFYVTVKEEEGWTVFNITYKGHVDMDTMFQPKMSSDEPWYRGPLILDLVSAVDGRITAENVGENAEITIRFPLPEDKMQKGT